MFFKIGVPQKFCNRKTPALESLFNEFADLKVCNFIKKGFQNRCFPMNIAKFLRTAFLIGHLRWVLLSVLGIFRPSLLNQKHNVGWFLLKMFVDIPRVCSLHNSRNYCNTFILIHLQKRKTCPK